MTQRDDYSITPLQTVREDFVRDAVQEAACDEALSLVSARREATKGGSYQWEQS